MKVLTQNNIKITFLVVLLTNFLVLMTDLVNQLLLNLLKQFWMNTECKYLILNTEYEYCKKVMIKHFNKNLIMTEEEEEFQSSNICWICEKLIGDEKVRDCCHVTGKFRGAAN